MLTGLKGLAVTKAASAFLPKTGAVAPRSALASSIGPSASAALDSVSRNSFSLKLEKHIDDIGKGKAYLSKGVNKDVRIRDNHNSQALAKLDPGTSSLYLSFRSAFRYDRSARFISGVNDVSITLDKLDSAKEDGEALKQKMDEIVAAYEAQQQSVPPGEARAGKEVVA